MLPYLAFVLFAMLSTCCVTLGAQTPASSTYPHSIDGFRLQLQDLISARRSADENLFRAKLAALALPNARAWIADHFPPAAVHTLQNDYATSESDFASRLKSLVEKMAAAPTLETIVWPSDPPATPGSLLAAHNLPAPSQPIALDAFLYGMLQPDEKMQPTINTSFVYFDGAFRYVGDIFPFWCSTLSKGQLSAAKLTKRVAPKYPKEARKAHLEGVVRLFAVIGKTGELRNLTLLAGDPLLRPAALVAVQQWRYQTTTLGGVPVEVQSVIEVHFQLNPR